MSRLRGGFRGLLAAFGAGIADELSADDPPDPPRKTRRLPPREQRQMIANEGARRKARARRKALSERTDEKEST